VRELFAENFMHEISGVPGAELLQQIGSVEIDGTRADAERTCGLLAGGAPDDLRQRNTFFGVKVSCPGNGFDRMSSAPLSLLISCLACLSSGVSRNSQLPFRRTIEH